MKLWILDGGWWLDVAVLCWLVCWGCADDSRARHLWLGGCRGRPEQPGDQCAAATRATSAARPAASSPAGPTHVSYCSPPELHLALGCVRVVGPRSSGPYTTPSPRPTPPGWRPTAHQGRSGSLFLESGAWMLTSGAWAEGGCQLAWGCSLTRWKKMVSNQNVITAQKL